jgi:hypothetical protein
LHFGGTTPAPHYYELVGVLYGRGYCHEHFEEIKKDHEGWTLIKRAGLSQL